MERGAKAKRIGLAGLEVAQDSLEDALGDLVRVGVGADPGPAAAADFLVVGREQPAVLARFEQLCVGPVTGRIRR